MREKEFEDELVRIRATSYQLFLLGFPHGNMKMPKDEVMLSEAMKTMDAFCEEVKEKWDELDWESVEFDVYGCRDDFHLFSYRGGEVVEDHRQEERPKNPEKVFCYMMDERETPPRKMSSPIKAYAEWAEREMDKYLKFCTEDIHRYCKKKSEDEVNPELVFFDVYGDEEGLDYRYSYKNGKTYVRRFSMAEEKKRKELLEQNRKTIVKVWRAYPEGSELQHEYEVPACTMDMLLVKNRRMIYMEQKVAEAEGKALNPDDFFFEVFDKETGAFLKKYRIVGYDIVEEKGENEIKTYDSLAFMKKS